MCCRCVRRILREEFRTPQAEVREAVRLLRTRVEIVRPSELGQPVCRDADDDMVLATAQAGQCVATVTGDADLLVLEQWRHIAIIRPRDFWRFEAGR